MTETAVYLCTHGGQYHTHMCGGCGSVFGFTSEYCESRRYYDPCIDCGVLNWTLDILPQNPAEVQTVNAVSPYPELTPETLEIISHNQEEGYPLIEIKGGGIDSVVVSESNEDTLDYIINELRKKRAILESILEEDDNEE